MATNHLTICPRCAYDKLQKVRRGHQGAFVDGFLVGLLVAVLLVLAYLVATLGMVGS